MLAFGLNKKLCNDFLKKQAVIGNLDEGESRPEAGRAALLGTKAWQTGVSRPAERVSPRSTRNTVLNCLVLTPHPAPHFYLFKCMGRFSVHLEISFCWAGFARREELARSVFTVRAKGEDVMWCSGSELESGQTLATSCPSF